ncbi:neuronal acetylcholine receptor subunit alpha-7-like isoform X1 [Thrips palmi]|uniref:Neuronal acetylcholine receptor subunit alpha-7-like isoform X1 n=1 Tax=Thrips palmi TaxID=161013 RepID=A0A6P8ZMY0_THRPL|nr:neuronal acetylcholine receptor subunit alpha-7-like isoform X1 [Thrips palmi]
MGDPGRAAGAAGAAAIPTRPYRPYRRRPYLRLGVHMLPMDPGSLLLFLVCCLLLVQESLQGPHEKRLLHSLLDHYNVLERPVANESDPLQLSFGLTLMQIIDVDEKNQLLITNIWLKLEWNDVNLRWNTSEFGGVKDLRIPPHRIWKPDVLMYNSADEGFDGTYPTNVVVRNNGSCLYVPPGIFKSTCKIDITWFPFDDQKCEMKFGSWTYDGFQLDLQLQDDAGGDVSSFITNGEWDLLGMPAFRHLVNYTCCPDDFYVDITFVLHIRRRTLFYTINLIVPCVIISSMTLLGFTLPHECGEKLTLGVTILLSLSVFSLMIAECLPQTSEAIPLLGTYFNCIMFMVASSVVSTILILNYHHRSADTHEMSPWVRCLFLQWLPCILRMSRPVPENEAGGSPGSRKSPQSLELKERSSKSLLANVLDIDDDFRHHGTLQGHPMSSGVPGTGYLRHADDGAAGGTLLHHAAAAAAGAGCLGPHRELTLILKELHHITDKLRKTDEAEEITNDWKFAAMVVDRLCLFIFTLFTVIATIAVLFSAPHIIVT